MVELVGPGVNDGVAIEFIHGGHDAVLELLFGCDADVAQDRAGELGEEALDEALSRCRAAGAKWSAKCRRLRNCQAAATAVRHVVIATARSARCVWAETRWRWTLKVL